MATNYQNFSNPTITSDQPMGWQSAQQNTAQAINSIGSYLAKQQGNVQQLQMQQASDLSKAKMMDQLYYGGAHGQMIDSMLSQNPYGRHLISPQGQGQQPQGQGMAQSANQPMGGNPNMFGGMIGSAGTTPYGTGMLPQPTVQGIPQGSTDQSGGMSMSPVSTGSTLTMGGMEPPKISMSNVNPMGEQIKAQANAQGAANVAPSKEYSEKMAGAQAQASENIARDSSQMTSVFQTLKNLHDIHSQLANSNLAGTDLGDLASENLGHVGTLSALFGQKPADVQNSLVSPENQNLLGQFQSGRNEGITRAIQPIQNQVDKVGSSRISDSLMHMTEGEYGRLEDTQPQFNGKTLGTARTLYRITLASQNYADQLKAQGIQLNGNDKNFNPDAIAKTIYNNANSIEMTPAQKSDFNSYANKIMGTQGQDYSSATPQKSMGGSLNPVTNPADPAKQGNQMPSFNPKTQKVQQNSRTGEYRVVNL